MCRLDPKALSSSMPDDCNQRNESPPKRRRITVIIAVVGSLRLGSQCHGTGRRERDGGCATR